jgi:CBS domain-containing protein
LPDSNPTDIRPADTLICIECGFANETGTAECEACDADLFRSEQVRWQTPFDQHLLGDLVDVLQPRTPLLVEARAPVTFAVEEMRAHHTGCVLVVENGTVRGIFTEHDLLSRVLAPGLAPRDVPLDRVMTPDPVVLRRDDSLAVAINKMVVGSFLHIPLVDPAGRIDGIVSARDLLTRLYDLIQL